MSDWGVGYAMGIATGLAIGLVAGRKRVKWSELSEKEKKTRIAIITAGVAVLAVGIVVFALLDK